MSLIGQFNLSVITEMGALEGLLPEWETLDASLSPRTPFTSPMWCLAWWRHFHRNTLLAHDALRVYVLRDPVGRLVAVAPMMLTSRPRFGPLRIRQLQFFGADTNVTELRGPICRAEAMHDVVARLSQYLDGQHHEWDWIQWRGVRKTVETAIWVEHKAGLRLTGETPDFYLPLPSSWAALNGGLTRNMKEAIRKSYNALARDGHAFTFRVIDQPEQVAAAVDIFLNLHTARADLAGTVDHINAFASPGNRVFLHAIAREHAAHGRFRAFQLVIGDVVVATRLAFVCGDELYLYFSGYLPEWGKYSAMTTVVVEIMKWAISQRFKIVNLSFGCDRSKLRWQPERCDYIGGFSVSRNRRAQLLWPGYSVAWRRYHPAVPIAVTAIAKGIPSAAAGATAPHGALAAAG